MLSTSLEHYAGQVGDGATDITTELETALRATAAGGGCLHIPPGDWLVTRDLVLDGLTAPIAIRGAGAGVSRLVFAGCSGPQFNFVQSGYQQPAGLDLCDLGLVARGVAGTALSVNYGTPQVTNDHYRPSITMDRCRVESSDSGWWAAGLDLADAWNVSLSNLHLSGGAQGGNWNALTGAALKLRRMCVNTHLSNVRGAFWHTGLECHADGVDNPHAHNPEGIFASNCSFVAVQKGVSIRGNPAGTGRISTFTWQGGMIENRVGGVQNACFGFELSRVWTALLAGTQCITETLAAPAPNVAVFLDECHGVTVQGNDLNAYRYGLVTNGATRAVSVAGNTFTNTAEQVVFRAGTKESRSTGNVRVNVDYAERDEDGENHVAH